MIEQYFEKIERTISYFKNIRAYNLTKKIYNDRQGFISGVIIFDDNTRLEFVEVKNTEIKPKIKYRYHYMDKDNNLIFRCDNAQHHQAIKTFPHHKHLKENVIESHEYTLHEILLEIKQCRIND